MGTMTFAAALAEAREGLEAEEVNPRWVACHAVLGRRPEGWEFLVWTGERWRDFAKLRGWPCGCPGCKADPSGHVFFNMGLEDGQRAFDEWLRGLVADVAAGAPAPATIVGTMP